MCFEPDDSPLLHILQAIENISMFVGDMTFEDYKADLLVRSAVERMVQILTEAVFRLGRDADTAFPGVDWRGLRGMGNFLRHDYARVEDAVIWGAVKSDLPELERSVRAILKHLPEAER